MRCIVGVLLALSTLLGTHDAFFSLGLFRKRKENKTRRRFFEPSSSTLPELRLLQGIVERKNTIPILANVLMEAVQMTHSRSHVIATVRGEPKKLEASEAKRSTMAKADRRLPGRHCWVAGPSRRGSRPVSRHRMRTDTEGPIPSKSARN